MFKSNYSQLYDRIETSFNVEEVTPDIIESWLVQGKEGGKIKNGFDKKGKQRYTNSKGISSAGRTNIRRLAEKVGVTGEIYKEIDTEQDYDKLRILRNQAKDLDIYSKEVTEKVEDKMRLISEEMVEITEERKEERIKLEKQESQLKKIESKIPITSIEELSKLENKLDKLNIDTTEVRGLINERLAELEEEKLERLKVKQEKNLNKLIDKISSARTINALYSLEGKLDDFNEIDTMEVRGMINERLLELEEVKEENIRMQEEALKRKEALRAEGIFDFG